MTDFRAREAERQIALRKAGLFPGSESRAGIIDGRQRAYYLPRDLWVENLDEKIRGRALLYFDRRDIAWSGHRASLLSSQVCCVNHLLLFATRPEPLARLLEPVLGPGIEMLPLRSEGLHGEPWYVAFEYFGPFGSDFLGEGSGGRLKRGSKSTSVDAMVRYRSAQTIELALIEWKYTERYDDQSPLSRVLERKRRYRPVVDRNDGLFRLDRTVPLERLCVEPFYQLLRQQLLAREMERARVLDADVVRVLHVSPRANEEVAALNTGAISHLGATPTSGWAAMLAQADRFVPAATEDLFGPSVHPHAADLLSYARRRYAFTSDRSLDIPLTATQSRS